MTNIQQIFTPGDEWLYYKFYTGYKTADTILTEFILPTTNKLINDGLVSKWFFIRYEDPKPHIRFRILVPDKNNYSKIMQIINKETKRIVSAKLIWLVQIDTYKRELKRYGYNSIEIAEELFFHDSNMIVKFIEMLDEGGEKYRWQFGINAIDTLLDDFHFCLLKKTELIEIMVKSYSNEFLMDKSLKLQLDTKFRKNRETIEILINSDGSKSEIVTALALLNEKTQNTEPCILKLMKLNKEGTIETEFNQLVASFIHMMLNRLFKSKQRLHELVLYYFLTKQYKSMIARENNKKE